MSSISFASIASMAGGSFIFRSYSATRGGSRHARAQALVEYLGSDRSPRAPDCVLYAIDQLGELRRAEASRILTSYLDFRKPGPTPVPAMERICVSTCTRLTQRKS